MIQKREMRREKAKKAKRSSEEEGKGGSQRLCSRDHIQTNGLSKSTRQAVDCDFNWGSRGKASIASQSLLPTQTIVCSLCSRLHGCMQDLLFFLLLFAFSRAKGEIDGLDPILEGTQTWKLGRGSSSREMKREMSSLYIHYTIEVLIC